MTDIKLKMFGERERWKKILDKAKAKHMSKDIIVTFSDYGNVLALVQVIAKGLYTPGIPHISHVPKDNGKLREITVLPEEDRIIFAVIADVYYDLYSDWIHPSCVSYQRGKSVPKIVKSIRNKISTGGYKIDLSKFFDTVPIEVIDQLLCETSTGSPIDELVYQYYHTNLVYEEGKLVERYKSLSQGFAVAALFSNLILRRVDEHMTSLCDFYVRYVDDILLISSDKESAYHILVEELKELGLSVNPDKVKAVDSNCAIDFLGARISHEEVSIAPKSLKGIKNRVKAICNQYPKYNAKALQDAVKSVQDYLFCSDKHGRTLFDYYCNLCTCKDSFIELDNYCKDTLRATYTGKHVPKINAKVDIQFVGYVSLIYLYNIYQMNYYAFKILQRTISAGYHIDRTLPRDLSPQTVITELEKIWYYVANYESYRNIFYVESLADENCTTLPTILNMYFKQALHLISRCNYNSNRPFIASENYSGLVILQYWYT